MRTDSEILSPRLQLRGTLHLVEELERQAPSAAPQRRRAAEVASMEQTRMEPKLVDSKDGWRNASGSGSAAEQAQAPLGWAVATVPALWADTQELAALAAVHSELAERILVDSAAPR